jgi:ABC-type sugar transport system ATPase subunit
MLSNAEQTHGDPHSDASPTAQSLLVVSGVSKRFPGVAALTDVDFAVGRGEIHALLGENGAGKSTLIKLITGLMRPDSGKFFIEGNRVEIATPRVAQRLGISLVPQDIMMVPALSIGRNILLGFERPFATQGDLKKAEIDLVEDALHQIGAKFHHSTPTASLSVPDLRLAQIARTLIRPGSVIILDEPTAVLSEPDADHLLERLMSFRDLGKGIVYVSHRLSEVMRIADRATILRDGKRVSHLERSEFDRAQIVAAMARVEPRTSSTAKRLSPAATPLFAPVTGKALLKVDKLCLIGRYRDVSFSAREGEIVGVAGVQGSGHGYLVRGLSGMDPWDTGEVTICDRQSSSGSVLAAFNHGMAFIPADRRRSAIVSKSSVQENLTLGRNVRLKCRRFGIRWLAHERAMASELLEELSIRAADLRTLAGSLSGGNQQKLALARALEGNSRVLLLEEPTQGVDIRSKAEIHALIKRVAADQRRAVVVASSEFEELLDLADVIHVMCLGRIVATFSRGEASYRDILHHALP